MKTLLIAISVVVLAGVRGSCADEPAADSVQQATSDEANEQRVQAEKCAIKRVLLLSMMHLVRERHVLPAQYAAECVAMAKRLQAPPAFITCYEAGNSGKLGGRAHYDNHRTMKALLIKYGIDELAIRLLAEDVHCTLQQARELADWLPVQFLFNLIPPQHHISREEFDRQLAALSRLYSQAADEYAKVSDRASADAAADALLTSLPILAETQDVRIFMSKLRDADRDAFLHALGPVAKQLSNLRVKLVESNFFGSVKLAMIDALICN